jgi:HK97 family phage prohead protease
METKVLDLEAAQLKAGAVVATGLRTLEFYAAAFSKTPDLNGDIIDPHAFDGWLPRFYAAGKPLPISFSHAAVLDGIDPTNIIGYAPADADHVWVDDYGLRIKGYLETSSEKGKAVEWQIEQGILQGASMAYRVGKGGRTKVDGETGFLIKEITDVGEVGPTPNPANQEAVLLWLKTEGLLEDEPEVPYMTVAEFRETFETKAVDNSAWDGNRAMSACSSAADYRQICAAEHTVGDPDERQHWALPHHYLGRGPNAAGVAAAKGRIDQTQNISDAERSSARSHLDRHTSEIEAATKAAEEEPEPATKVGEDLLELSHQASPAYIQAAHDALVRGGAKCASGGAETSTATEPLSDDDVVAARVRRLRFMRTSLP